MKDSYLTQFVRDRKGNPRGIVVSTKMHDEDHIRIGWSYTNLKIGDRFDKDRGLIIAKDRIRTDTNRKIPCAVLKVATNGFIARSLRYFKASNVSIAGNTQIVSGTQNINSIEF